MFLKFLSSSIPWCFFYTSLIITVETLSADEVFIAAGPQTATVIEILQEVIDGTLKHDAQVPNFMAEGRTCSVSIPWPEGPDHGGKTNESGLRSNWSIETISDATNKNTEPRKTQKSQPPIVS